MKPRADRRWRRLYLAPIHRPGGTKLSLAGAGSAVMAGFVSIAVLAAATSHASTPNTAAPSTNEASMNALKSQLVGTWTLASYEETPVGAKAAFYPMGADAEGAIIYTADGYVSVHIQRAGRKHDSGGDMLDTSTGSSMDYIGYLGTYTIDPQTMIVRHHIVAASLPNLIGTAFPRQFSIDGTTLTIGSATPIKQGGREVVSRIVWKRAEDAK